MVVAPVSMEMAGSNTDKSITTARMMTMMRCVRFFTDYPPSDRAEDGPAPVQRAFRPAYTCKNFRIASTEPQPPMAAPARRKQPSTLQAMVEKAMRGNRVSAPLCSTARNTRV